MDGDLKWWFPFKKLCSSLATTLPTICCLTGESIEKRLEDLSFVDAWFSLFQGLLINDSTCIRIWNHCFKFCFLLQRHICCQGTKVKSDHFYQIKNTVPLMFLVYEKELHSPQQVSQSLIQFYPMFKWLACAYDLTLWGHYFQGWWGFVSFCYFAIDSYVFDLHVCILVSFLCSGILHPLLGPQDFLSSCHFSSYFHKSNVFFHFQLCQITNCLSLSMNNFMFLKICWCKITQLLDYVMDSPNLRSWDFVLFC